MNVLLFKFRCNIFIGVRIIKEMPGSVVSGTHCIKTKMQRTIILPVAYMGMKQSSLALRDEHRLRFSENIVLRKIQYLSLKRRR